MQYMGRNLPCGVEVIPSYIRKATFNLHPFTYIWITSYALFIRVCIKMYRYVDGARMGQGWGNGSADPRTSRRVKISHVRLFPPTWGSDQEKHT
jgi:hypothetical protein